MDQVLVPAMLVGLIAAYPGWLMSQKAFFISRWRILTVIMGLAMPFAIAIPIFYLPFWMAKGKELKPYDTFTELIIYSIIPVGCVALFAYVLDHLHESPRRSLIAGSACFAIVLLPVLYYLFCNQMHADMGITIKP